jgi:hypothetical protein
MGQDNATQLGPLERASLNLSSTYKTMDKVQNKPNSSVQFVKRAPNFCHLSAIYLIDARSIKMNLIYL